MADVAIAAVKVTDGVATSGVAPTGQLLVATSVMGNLSSNFLGSALDTSLWTSALTGAGTVAVANAEASLVVTTAAADSSLIQTPQNLALIAGPIYTVRYLLRQTAAVANNSRFWGMVAPATLAFTDGYLFQLVGTALSAVAIRGSVSVTVAITAPAFTLDANYHLYEIRAIGTRYAQFFIDGALVATIDSKGTTAPLTNTTVLHAFIANRNTALAASGSTLVAQQVEGERQSTESESRMTRISANGTVVIKGSAGLLLGVNIQTAGGVANQLTLFDDTSPTTTTAIANINCNVTREIDLFETSFGRGLVATLAGGTAADLTIHFT